MKKWLLNKLKDRIVAWFKATYGNFVFLDRFMWRPIESMLLKSWLNDCALEDLRDLINWLLGVGGQFRLDNNGAGLERAWFNYVKFRAFENHRKSKLANDVNLHLCDY